MTTQLLTESPSDGSVLAPLSSRAPDQGILANELVHVLHTWVTDISRSPSSEDSLGTPALR